MAKGLTTNEVQAHLAGLYAMDVSRETIAMITDRVLQAMVDRRSRPLDLGGFHWPLRILE